MIKVFMPDGSPREFRDAKTWEVDTNGLLSIRADRTTTVLAMFAPGMWAYVRLAS